MYPGSSQKASSVRGSPYSHNTGKELSPEHHAELIHIRTTIPVTILNLELIIRCRVSIFACFAFSRTRYETVQ